MPSLITLCLLPQSHPARFIALLQTAEGRRLVAKVWTLWGITLLSILFVGSYLFQNNLWVLPVLTLGAYAIVMFFTGSAIPITWNASFWFLYTISPLMLMVYTITVFGVYLPYIGNIFYLIYAYSVGSLIAVAGVVWVYKEENQRLRYDERRQKGGVEAALPPLQKWRKVIVTRWVIAILAILITLPLPFIVSSQEQTTAWWIVGIAIAFAAGVLHIEATIALLTGYPAVTGNSQEEYKSTFAGRFSLWIPKPIEGDSAPNPSEMAQKWLALLWDGTAPQAIVGYLQRLKAATRHDFLFALSLYAGGGEALGLIAASSSLPQNVRDSAKALRLVAEEAALPLQFQQWRTALSSAIPVLHHTNPPLAELLVAVLDSMNTTRLNPNDSRTTIKFSQFLNELVPLYGNPVMLNSALQEMSWLVVLYHQLVQHQNAFATWRID